MRKYPEGNGVQPPSNRKFVKDDAVNGRLREYRPGSVAGGGVVFRDEHGASVCHEET
ncbi:MAG: hypothetical protein RL112_1113 [Planctomycetota bacterium]